MLGSTLDQNNYPIQKDQPWFPMSAMRSLSLSIKMLLNILGEFLGFSIQNLFDTNATQNAHTGAKAHRLSHHTSTYVVNCGLLATQWKKKKKVKKSKIFGSTYVTHMGRHEFQPNFAIVCISPNASFVKTFYIDMHALCHRNNNNWSLPHCNTAGPTNDLIQIDGQSHP